MENSEPLDRYEATLVGYIKQLLLNLGLWVPWGQFSQPQFGRLEGVNDPQTWSFNVCALSLFVRFLPNHPHFRLRRIQYAHQRRDQSAEGSHRHWSNKPVHRDGDQGVSQMDRLGGND